MRGHAALSLGLLLGGLLVSGTSAAEDMLAPQSESAPFWRRARDPGAARAEALVRQGRALLVPALRVSFLVGKEASIQRRVGIENALSRFERARELTPQDPELLFLTGRALSAWQREAGDRAEHKSEEAIACFLALRAADAWYEAETVAFELGILYTREARFDDARAEYERALRLRLDADADNAALGNLAEVTMLAGDAERAVPLYERAVREATSDHRLLSLWGLAVALDRLGERARAIETAQEALRSDQRPMQVLEQSGVFFVPAHERFYYRGLGFLAQAQLDAEALRPAPAGPVRLELDLRQVSAEALTRLSRAAREGKALGLNGPLFEIEVRALGALKGRLPRSSTAANAQRDGGAAAEQRAKALTGLIDSLVSFVRYLGAAGETGAWCSDARAHVQELNQALASIVWKSNAK